MELKRIDLTALAVVPDEAPFAHGIASLPPETWADLSERGYPGIGYWPVADEGVPYDPKTHRLGAEVPAVDAARQCVVRKRELVKLTPDELATAAAARQAQARAEAKTARAEAIARITVTTAAGHTFDGDEDSQGRMARAILGLQLAGETVFPGGWTLADNSVLENPPLAELAEALLLAGQEQAKLWTIPM